MQRPTDRLRDGTVTWSLTTLQRTLREAPDGLPHVGTYTIWCVLHDAGYSWQREQTWCPTGTALRTRKDGPLTVSDPDTAPKKLIEQAYTMSESSSRCAAEQGHAHRDHGTDRAAELG